MAFIVVLTGLNLVGVRPVGRAAVVLGVLALAPVALLVVVGADRRARRPWRPFVAEEQSLVGGLGLGLAVMMWNYSGWDTPSTTLGETRAPERAFRTRALRRAAVIALAYVLPVGVGLASGATAGRRGTRARCPRSRRRSAAPGSATPSRPGRW